MCSRDEKLVGCDPAVGSLGAPVETESWRDRLITEAGKRILMGFQWAVI